MPSGARATKVVAVVGAAAAVIVGLILAAGATRQTLIDEPTPSTVAGQAFTPRPQSGPLLEIVPDAMAQPESAPATAPDDDATSPTGAPGDPGAGPAAKVEAALSLIGFDWRRQLPGWTLQIAGARQGLLGLTTSAERRIAIYLRPSMSTDALAHVIAHELGHAMDLTHLDGDDRLAFQVTRGRALGARWWADNAASDFATGAGDWAESFAFMVTGGRGPWSSTLGPPPNLAQQAVMRELMR